MTWWRIFAAVLAVVLGLSIVWAAMSSGDLHGSIWQQGGVILTLPWGIVAMLDLYVGFALMAMIMMLAERSFISGFLFALPLLLLGNVWAAIWLIIRLPSLSRRLTAPDWRAQP